ncbi:hypothetical protein CHCC15381_0435 [Bacillus paralicheniformis]|uniref:Uncharacterized protein n=1 Tax=Bacillus paralicheniformis TaxID=1648923 RepID=A0ABY3FXT0_9BACI|nr:hypothetical protein CHCC15381_0435 [Bacillus paralicheniformis]
MPRLYLADLFTKLIAKKANEGGGYAARRSENVGADVK